MSSTNLDLLEVLPQIDNTLGWSHDNPATPSIIPFLPNEIHLTIIDHAVKNALSLTVEPPHWPAREYGVLPQSIRKLAKVNRFYHDEVMKSYLRNHTFEYGKTFARSFYTPRPDLQFEWREHITSLEIELRRADRHLWESDSDSSDNPLNGPDVGKHYALAGLASFPNLTEIVISVDHPRPFRWKRLLDRLGDKPSYNRIVRHWLYNTNPRDMTKKISEAAVLACPSLKVITMEYTNRLGRQSARSRQVCSNLYIGSWTVVDGLIQTLVKVPDVGSLLREVKEDISYLRGNGPGSPFYMPMLRGYRKKASRWERNLQQNSEDSSSE